MEAILQWGIEIITSIQSIHNPILDNIFFAITLLGNFEFFLIIIPLVYWCIDEEQGIVLGVVLIFTGFTNNFFKELWMQPRPFNMKSSLKLAHASGYGLPSGHSQGSVVFWGIIGKWIGKKTGLILAITLPLLIGFSRIYLGVHFPTDVFVGWGFGIIILLLYIFLWQKIYTAVSHLPFITKAALIILIGTAMYLANQGDIVSAAIFMSMLSGYMLMKHYSHFDAKGPIKNRIFRFVIGISITAFLYLGLKFIFPAKGQEFYAMTKFIRYGLIGLWVSFGAPFIFLKTGLAQEKSDSLVEEITE
jgi:membrane-associated phospholipid phosphatase